jgi:dihydroorotase (multifunctional complex type)
LAVDLVLRDAKIFANGEVLEGGVAVDEGKIVDVTKDSNLPSGSDKIKLKGCLILPGLIDVHVHLRGQMQAYEEDFFTGTAAAVAGGITTVLDMPNNQPVTMDPSSLRERMRAARRDIVANVGFYSAFPKSEDDVEEVVVEGASAFKLYLHNQIGGVDVDNDEALMRAFKRTSALGIPVAVHAEDKSMIETFAEAERKLGHRDIETYLKTHSPEVEVKAVERTLTLADKSKAQVHFCHVSSGKSVTMIDNARRKGLRVSCEVTPHHLLLTSEKLKQRGTMMLTDPPLRQRHIVDKLWNSMHNGQIDIVASDHAPHLITEKKAESVWDVKPGIPGLETLLPLLLTKVNERQLTVAELVKLTSEKPAEIFHIPLEGHIKEGYNANFTIVDLHKRGIVDAGKFNSKAKYSPFDGWRVEGMPVKTIVNGQLVMEDGEIVGARGVGRVLRGRALEKAS